MGVDVAKCNQYEVYGLVSSRDETIRYVGMTVRGRRARFARHGRDCAAGKNCALYQWMRSEQDAGYTVFPVLIETCPDPITLATREVYWIATLPDLLNQQRGGNLRAPDVAARARMSESARKRFTDPAERAKIWPPTRSRETSDETRQKLSAANRRRLQDPAERERLAAQSRGRKLSPEHRAALVRANLGKKHSAEALAKMRAAKIGKPWKPGHVRWHVKRGIMNPDCIFCQP